MSKRTKGSKGVSNGSTIPESSSLAVATSSEALSVKAEDRIYIDNSNPSDLKVTCDDAVERVSKEKQAPLLEIVDRLNPHTICCRF